MESQKKYQPTFSFELFPPKTETGMEKMKSTVRRLSTLNPRFFSVTYGAGGSTRDKTLDTVTWLRAQQLDTAPHISCIGSSREHIRELLERYQQEGIKRIVALRGDMPSGMGGGGDFRYANELVDFIRSVTGDHFHIEVAAYPEFHPQAPDAMADLVNFKRKIDAGANGAITQYFYNPDGYYRFVDSCEQLNLEIPIVPGIMPINNYTQLGRFSDACGAEIPRWIRRRLQGFADDIESIRAFGIDVVTELCQKLLDQGAPGLHFYTMNQSGPSQTIWKNLGLSAR
ncbi:MAG: methylenetetrahydrofolate reductase [NAD(P)H] [Gammaproteobacteria bacterium]|nr:methylenetetrahydrofolate reductase [NAD(P)H] [Gammaproteobacteria bacterium]